MIADPIIDWPVTGGLRQTRQKYCGSDFWSEGFFFADRRRFVAKGFGYAV